MGAPLAPRRFRFQRAVWACVLGPGLACAQPFLAGLSGCVFFLRFGFFFSFFFFPGFVVSVPPSPFFRAGLVALFFFFFFRVPFPPGMLLLAWCCRFWVGGPPVPLWGCFFFFFVAFWGGAWPPVVVLAGCLAAVGCFSAFSPSPLPFCFFLGGGGACLFLPLPSLGWRTHWPAFSVVFRAAVFSCVLCGHVPAPWVGWALYTVGSAPLLAGLGPSSAGWAAAPGGCLWFWVRGLGLFVSLPLCGAGCNLLGGPSPLSPGALWPRVWPAVLVCGVVARRLPGCAVAGFG